MADGRVQDSEDATVGPSLRLVAHVSGLGRRPAPGACRGKGAGVGAAANEDGVGHGGRLAGRSSRCKEVGSAMEGSSLARAAGATAAAGRPDAPPHPCLLCCGPHGREGQLRRSWRRVQRPPPPLLFKSSKPSRECIGGCRALNYGEAPGPVCLVPRSFLVEKGMDLPWSSCLCSSA